MREVRGRLTSLEVSVANLHGDFAGQSGRIDRVENRLERIEQRLDLRDA
jgi:predicted nuclease with TOPRIM domain